MDSSWKEDEDEDLRNVFVPEAFYFVSGSCGGRAFAFSFIVFRTKLYNPPMYSCHHIYRWLCTFSVSAVTIMFCVRPKVALQCDIALCKRCTLTLRKEALSPPGGARPCRGSQPQITGLVPPNNSKTPFIAIHFETFSSIFVSCNSLKMDEFNLRLKGTPSSSKQGT